MDHQGRAERLHRVAVLIPALNEREALPMLLAPLAEWGPGRVVVVDNGSTDGTGEVARRHGAEVVEEARRGYGSACLAGLAHLDASGATEPVVVFLDADHPEDVESLSDLVAPVLAGSADLALGVRRDVHGGTGNLHRHARLGNRLVLGAVRLIFGYGFPDLPPLRAVSREALRRLEMDDRTWGWTLQMQLRARSGGLALAWLDVPHRPRRLGTSKISGSLVTSLRVGGRMAWTLIRERLRAARGSGGGHT